MAQTQRNEVEQIPLLPPQIVEVDKMKINPKALFPVILSTFLISPSFSSEDMELQKIIKTAYDNPVAKKALEEEKIFRDQTNKELDLLREKIKTTSVEKVESWKERCLQGIKSDQLQIKALTTLDTKYPEYISYFPLKFNKMIEITDEAAKLFNGHFDFLSQGKLPDDSYSYATEKVTISGDTTSLHGNPKSTNFKAALYYMLSHATEQPTSIQNLNLLESKTPWVDSSATVSVIPLPKTKETSEIVSNFKDSKSILYFSDELTPHGLSTFHSGYEFGGGRPNDRYSKEKLKSFGPYDCSSGISAKYFGSEVIFTGNFKDCFSDKNHKLRSNFEPVLEPKTVAAGQLYVHIKGTGGHTAVVLGQRENGNIVTLGHNRNRPDLEGLGIQEFPLHPKDDKTVMIFDIKDK